MLPEKERKYFFKQINYNIEKIKAGNVLYAPGSIAYYTATGNYFGYVNYKKNIETNVNTKVLIKSEGFKTLDYNIPTKLKKDALSPYSIDNLLINGKNKNDEVIAGNSIKIGAEVQIPYYPYGNLHWLNNIVLGFVLPEGVSVDRESIIAETKKNKNIKPVKFEDVDLYNGYKMYKVFIPSDVIIGFANEDLDTIDAGEILKFSAILNVDNEVKGQTVNLNRVLYVASVKTNELEPIYNGSAGSYNWAKKTDTYDLNGDGKTDDTIAGVNESNKLAFKIIPQTDFFTIKDFINVNNNDYGPKADINEKEDLLNYKLNFKFNKSANFDDFKYYIPIPKYNSGIDKHLIKNTDKIVQLGLQNNVEVVGDELFNIFYTVDSGMNIDKVDSANWVTAENVTNFNDVTMIKLVTKKTGTLSGNSEINFKFKYSGNDYLKEAGYKVELHSAGKLKYSINGNSTEGIFATNGVKINLNPTMKLPDVVLTAAPDRKPKISGNVNTYTVNESELSSFHNLHNVVLNTKEYIGNNLNMDSNEANKTFGITLSVNSGSEINLLSDNFATIQNAIIGNGKNAKFKYIIYNANNLSDDIMNRSINIVYKSNNGLTLKQKIVINRELKKIGDPATAIISKKAYGLFEQPLHTSKEVNIGKNTNFSVQFKVNYIPNLYNQRFFKFSKKLPIGTKITLYEYVGNKNPTYWYYKVKNETDSIDIADFVKMGYTDKKYNKINDNNYIKEVYMLMFDFKEVENNNLNKIQVHLEINSDRVENFISESLSANLHDNSVFTMKNTKEKFNIKDDINLIYNLESASFDIHNYHLAYCITVDENLPKDTYIIVNYKKSGKENVKYYKNSNNQFIIPLGQVENTGKSDILFKFNTDIELNKSSYNMVVDLMNSASEEFDTPLLGKKIIGKNITLENNISDSPSIKILDIDNRVIQKNDLSNNHSVGLNYLKSANSKITLELQKKNGTEYKKINDKLINVNGSFVNNDGVFDISLNNGNNDISIKLSESTNVGTYRLLFVIKDLNDNIIFKIPYSIIISDNLEMD